MNPAKVIICKILILEHLLDGQNALLNLVILLRDVLSVRFWCSVSDVDICLLGGLLFC